MTEMAKPRKVIRTVLRAVIACAAGLLLAYNGYIFIARTLFGVGMPTVFGFASAAVVSGSMADAIDTGDFIITRAQDEYAVGDVIMFYEAESNTYITHRIILVSGDTFVTKGDANNAQDDFSVPVSEVVGKVVSVWRGFGKVITFLQSPLGLFCLIGGGIVLWVLTDIGSEVFKKKDE